MNARTSLANYDSPGVYTLSGVTFHSKPLALAVTSVAAGTASFFMRHLLSPLSSCGEASWQAWLLPLPPEEVFYR